MSGYDDYFKKARKNSQEGKARVAPRRSGALASPSPGKKNLRTKDANERMLQAMGVKRRKKSGVSWRLAIVSLAGFIIAGWGMFFIEDVDEFLSKIEVKAFGTASAQEAKVEKEHQAPTSQIPAPKEAKKPMDPLEAQVSKSPWTEEEINHLKRLADRKNELDLREKELQEVEAELERQRASISEKLNQLQEVRRDIASTLKDRVETDDEKVGKLVEFYSGMKPQMAAQVFQDLDEDLAVEVLGRMKKQNAAAIMNLLTAEKAKVLSEKFAGYKKK